MRLKRINEDSPWVAYAEAGSTGDCVLEQQIADLLADPKTSAYAVGIAALLDAIPTNGPRQLGAKLYHYVDEENEIYQFTKGPFRLLCFQSGGRVVICSHIFRKKSDRTPKREVANAVTLRERYLAALASGELEFIED